MDTERLESLALQFAAIGTQAASIREMTENRLLGQFAEIIGHYVELAKDEIRYLQQEKDACK